MYVNETHAPMSVMSTQANPPPGAWAHSQRQMKKANRFARERINKLNAIDFDWTWIGVDWLLRSFSYAFLKGFGKFWIGSDKLLIWFGNALF